VKSLALDHRSRMPLHAQVEELLRALIRQPEYEAGKLLPDEVSLARKLGVSRGTLRAGIARLMYEGLLERRAGVGTRVARHALPSGVGAWHSFTQEMHRRGLTVQTFKLQTRMLPAPRPVAAALEIAEGTPVLRLERLRGWDDEPVVLFTSWLHPRLGVSPEEDFSRPLYDVIEARSGVAADRSREELSAVSADAALARRLQVKKGAPLLWRRRVVLDPSGRPIEFAVVHYRGDRFTLTLDLRREQP